MGTANAHTSRLWRGGAGLEKNSGSLLAVIPPPAPPRPAPPRPAPPRPAPPRPAPPRAQGFENFLLCSQALALSANRMPKPTRCPTRHRMHEAENPAAENAPYHRTSMRHPLVMVQNTGCAVAEALSPIRLLVVSLMLASTRPPPNTSPRIPSGPVQKAESLHLS